MPCDAQGVRGAGCGLDRLETASGFVPTLEFKELNKGHRGAVLACTGRHKDCLQDRQGLLTATTRAPEGAQLGVSVMERHASAGCINGECVVGGDTNNSLPLFHHGALTSLSANTASPSPSAWCCRCAPSVPCHEGLRASPAMSTELMLSRTGGRGGKADFFARDNGGSGSGGTGLLPAPAPLRPGVAVSGGAPDMTAKAEVESDLR